MMLDSKTAVVTGANRGIGLAITERFLAEGARVFATHRSDPGGLSALEGDLTLVACDVTDRESVAALFAQVRREAGGLDVLVNNAGMLDDALLMMVREATWDAVVDTNARGTFFCMQRASKLMMRGGGSIVNMSSIVGVHGNPGQTAYAASKAAVIGLTRSAAFELGKMGIRVNAIAPGVIDTQMIAHLPENVVAGYLERTAMGRLGTGADVAGAAVFLASDMSAFVTGQVLGVDGGLRL